jgi:hypothetical protein
MKFKYSKLYWFLRNFEFLKVYFSPFKPPKLKFYFGKVAVGVPYHTPRTWKKATPQRAVDEAVKEMRRIREHNSKEGNYKLTELSFRELYDRCLSYRYPQPKKFGFDFSPLYWKTKWSETDYQLEAEPVWSVVAFGYQFAIMFRAVEAYHFWTCWLYYSRHTKGKTKDRLKQARKEFPCVWRNYTNGETKLICYWDEVIKKQYL